MALVDVCVCLWGGKGEEVEQCFVISGFWGFRKLKCVLLITNVAKLLLYALNALAHSNDLIVFILVLLPWGLSCETEAGFGRINVTRIS